MNRAVILAAGESSRMGKPKLLLPFGRISMIETVIERVAASRIDGVLVVLGAEKDKITDLIKRYAVSTVFNAAYRSGMLSSVQAGFLALPEDTQAVLIVLGDQPAVSPVVIDLLIESYVNTDKSIILPVHRGKRGHPVLIDIKYREKIAGLDPAVGLRAIMHDYSEDIFLVNVDDPAIHQDIDYPIDYERAKG